MPDFERVKYKDLKARQKENYNSHKISAALANYGYNIIRLTDYWHGADAIAVHIDGKTFLKVQIKGRFTLNEKYKGKDIWIAFVHRKDDNPEEIYVFPHDDLLKKKLPQIRETQSWKKHKNYSWGYLSKENKLLLSEYKR